MIDQTVLIWNGVAAEKVPIFLTSSMSIQILPSENGNSGLIYLGFNQDYGCFAVGMQNGFRIYNTDPLRQLERCDFNVRDGTGIGFVEMLSRSSFLGLLGGGHQARIPTNSACLWDSVEQRFVLELAYGSDVRAIRLRRDRIIIVLSMALKVYTFGTSPELVYQAETYQNPLGLCSVCQAVDYPIIAFPGRRQGSVIIANISGCSTGTAIHSATSTPPPRQILAHENALVALTLNQEGNLLATASRRGTLIRVFSTHDLELLHELRRGSNPALITCICFDSSSSRLGVASTHGTIHIFENLNPSLETSCSRNQTSAGRQMAKSAKFGFLIPRYFSSTLSRVRCVPETSFKTICAFSRKQADTLIVLSADGSYYKYNYAPNGTISREQSLNFLDFCDDESDL